MSTVGDLTYWETFNQLCLYFSGLTCVIFSQKKCYFLDSDMFDVSNFYFIYWNYFFLKRSIFYEYTVYYCDMFFTLNWPHWIITRCHKQASKHSSPVMICYRRDLVYTVTWHNWKSLDQSKGSPHATCDSESSNGIWKLDANWISSSRSPSLSCPES